MHPTAPATDDTALETWTRRRLPLLSTAGRLASTADGAEAEVLIRAYVLILAAEFQAFFSDLLKGIAQALVDALPAEVPLPLRQVLQDAMEHGRLVDFRNPDSATVRRDLVRFDVDVRTLLGTGDRAGRVLLGRLDQVIRTRNKLAHGAGSVSRLGPGQGPLTPVLVDEWTRDLDRLAGILDNVVAGHFATRLSVGMGRREPA